MNEETEVPIVTSHKEVPFNLSFLKFFDHFYINVISKDPPNFSKEEIEYASQYVIDLFEIEKLNSQLSGCYSLITTIAMCKRSAILSKWIVLLKNQLISYNLNKWKTFHNFLFSALFDENIAKFMMSKESFLSNILEETPNFSIKSHEEKQVLIESIKILILEVFQLYRDFLQDGFLYVRNVDDGASKAYYEFEKKLKKTNNYRDLSFNPMKLWNLLFKLDFIFPKVLEINLIIEEDSAYLKLRNTIAHSNIVPDFNLQNENKSIMELPVQLFQEQPRNG